MKRYLYDQILKDLKKKMVFITGPRQVGKTYLSKQIMRNYNSPQYLNFDDKDGRQIIIEQSWKLNTDLIIFDEIHKMKNWKNYLKGIFDSKMQNQSILVTGSARLDTLRKSGDSLAGRYFHLRLNPLSVKEVNDNFSPYNILEKFNKLSTFPEPFLTDSIEEASRWRNQYFKDLIREDIIDFSRIGEIKTMELLLNILRTKVGSTLSFNSLSEDLQVSPTTIQKYIQILESLYIIFLIRPFHKLLYRSLKKKPKLYFYDTGLIIGDDGIKLENNCAMSLLKYIQYQYDVKGKNIKLNYLRTKDKKEVDFIIVEDNYPKTLIEVKLSDRKPSKQLLYFSSKFPNAKKVQLIHNLKTEFDKKEIEFRNAGEWLNSLPV